MNRNKALLAVIAMVTLSTSLSAKPVSEQLETMQKNGYDLKRALELQFYGGSDMVCPDTLYNGGLLGATCPGYKPIPGVTAFTMIGDSRTDFARGHGDWHHRCMLGKYNRAPIHNIAIAGTTAANWRGYLNGHTLKCEDSKLFSDDVVIMLGGNDVMFAMPTFMFDVVNGPRRAEEVMNKTIADTKAIVDKLRSWNKDVIVQGHYNANVTYKDKYLLFTWGLTILSNTLFHLDEKTRIAFSYPHREWCEGGFEILFWFWWGQWWPYLQWNQCMFHHSEGQNDAAVSYAPIPQFFTPEMFNDGVHLSKYGYPVHAFHLIRSLLARGFY